MRITRVLILLFAVFAGIYLVPRLIVAWPFEQARYDEYVTQRMPRIQTLLNQALSERDGVCLHGDPYIVYLHEHKSSGPFALDDDPKIYRPECNRCDDLVEAGLLTKSVSETTDRFGIATFSARFTLTEFGKSVYIEELKPGRSLDYLLVNWKFCFGKTTLYKIEETLAPASFGGDVVVGVKYIAQVIDPHPFLFDPRSRPLRLPVPSNTTPALFPPRVTTIVFHASGGVDIDDSVKYGKYINER